MTRTLSELDAAITKCVDEIRELSEIRNGYDNNLDDLKSKIVILERELAAKQMALAALKQDIKEKDILLDALASQIPMGFGVVDCMVCGGKGKVSAFPSDLRHDITDPQSDVICVTCEGSGKRIAQRLLS